jgi:hypothetical protein
MKARVLVPLLVAAALVLASTATASASRSGDLHATKNCEGFSRQPRFVLPDHLVQPPPDPGRLEDHLSPAAAGPDPRRK